ncbi:MAG: hypothetical protein DRO04_00845 [Candidatus Iainarchaeum archaeon]|uniref:Uncharacterized protein n=1 Tax=Candidatus Iainarchaeum sp. TaxID=3101447 RepID=A0A497JHX4_9ARCH|nr:MAG: hypothetical protein DRO04_00845 [Candidatus Diapherotrites archaeon]
MLQIDTHFYPYRLLLRRRQPVELAVDLINTADKETLATIEISLDKMLSFTKGGLKKVEKVSSKIEPNKRKRFYFSIYPHVAVTPGEYAVQIVVTEYGRDYNDIKRRITKRTKLLVE